MKTHILLIIITLSLTTAINAQDGDTIYIFRNNNYVIAAPTNQIDTMTIAMEEDTMLTIYKKDLTQTSISTTTIDSITFYLPENYIRDIEGNIYPTVTLGTQTWMAANLKTTTYNDGTPIRNIPDHTTWLNNIDTKEGAYRWYLDNPTYRDSCYGPLYNWFTVTNNKLCPSGWHVPSNQEWSTLEFYLAANGYNYDGTIYTGNDRNIAGEKIAKALAATYSWKKYGAEGTIGNIDYPEFRNKTGFNAVGTGFTVDGGFLGTNHICVFWTTTPTSCYGTANDRTIGNSSPGSSMIQGGHGREHGASVRCIKD